MVVPKIRKGRVASAATGPSSMNSVNFQSAWAALLNVPLPCSIATVIGSADAEAGRLGRKNQRVPFLLFV